MDLTLPQRFYLLGYDLDHARLDVAGAQFRGQLLRTGALIELAGAGLVDVRDGKVVSSGTGRPDDPFAADVFGDVPSDEPGYLMAVIPRRSPDAESVVRAQLAAAGVLTVSEQTRRKVFRTIQVSVEKPEVVRTLRERARNAILVDLDPAKTPIEDAALAVLAAEAEVSCVFGIKERFEHAKAFKALAQRLDTAVPGLTMAFRSAVATSRSSNTGWSR